VDNSIRTTMTERSSHQPAQQQQQHLIKAKREKERKKEGLFVSDPRRKYSNINKFL